MAYSRLYLPIQIGVGTFTQDECSGFGKNITDSLATPPVHSFEYAGLMSGYDYFYYPSQHLGDGILSFGRILRGSRFKDFYEFSSLKKRFDAYVFIKESKELQNVEALPLFYTSDYIYKRTQNMNLILKELGN